MIRILLRIGLAGTMLLALGCGAGEDGAEARPAAEPSHIIRGSGKVLINGLPAALGTARQATTGAALVVTDCIDGPALDSSDDVLINGHAARKLSGSSDECRSLSSAVFSDNVLIGE